MSPVKCNSQVLSLFPYFRFSDYTVTIGQRAMLQELMNYSRGGRLEVFYEKTVLENFLKFTEKQLERSPVFSKFQALEGSLIFSEVARESYLKITEKENK